MQTIEIKSGEGLAVWLIKSGFTWAIISLHERKSFAACMHKVSPLPHNLLQNLPELTTAQTDIIPHFVLKKKKKYNESVKTKQVARTSHHLCLPGSLWHNRTILHQN